MPATLDRDAPRVPQNLRDVGGIPLAAGGRLREGVLYRSDAPRDGDDVPAGIVWPPHTVVDLRSPDEVPDEHPLAGPDTNVVALPLFRGAALAHMGEEEGSRDLTEIYAGLLRTSAPKLAEIARLVAHDETPVLVHCAAGKDRTGMAVAVILAAVGVGREEIVADYHRTEANMDGVVARYAAATDDGARIIRDVVETRPELLRAPVAAMEAALDALEAVDDGAVGLLRANGLDGEALDALRRRLTD